MCFMQFIHVLESLLAMHQGGGSFAVDATDHHTDFEDQEDHSPPYLVKAA